MSYPRQSILFVSGLDKSVNENQLYALFTEFPISYLKIAKDHATRESFGYAFVGFKSQQKAEEALNKLNYSKLQKKTIRITWYNREPNNYRNSPDYNVFVKKIAKTVTSREFHEFFNKFGNIISARLVEDEEGEVVGYGFVLYDNPTAAARAIAEGNNYELKGKKLFVGKFEKNRPKRPIQYNNVYVKNLPRSYSQKDVEAFFGKYGDLGSVLLREPEGKNLENLPEQKRTEILSHKYAFVCFKNPESAMRVVNEVPYLKTSNKSYNDELLGLINVFKKFNVVPDEHNHRFACYLMENITSYKNDVGVENRVREHAEKFLLDLNTNNGVFIVKDKTDRIECCQALKKKDRLRKLNLLHEKIKKEIREKYRYCNLYVKNLPDSIDDEEFRKLFQEFGSIRSCKTVRKELYQSYLGIKRSVKVSGYVCFEESKIAKEAKDKLNGTSPFPNLPKLYIDFHQSKHERTEILKLQMISNSNKPMKGQDPSGNLFRGLKFNGGIFGPHFLRKFPPQTGFSAPKSSPHPMMVAPFNQGFNQMQQGVPPHMIMTNNQHIAPHFINPDQRRDYFGEKVYNKMTNSPNFQQYGNFFSKITGIFLDMPDDYILKILSDEQFFNEQVDETIKQLYAQQQH